MAVKLFGFIFLFSSMQAFGSDLFLRECSRSKEIQIVFYETMSCGNVEVHLSKSFNGFFYLKITVYAGALKSHEEYFKQLELKLGKFVTLDSGHEQLVLYNIEGKDIIQILKEVFKEEALQGV